MTKKKLAVFFGNERRTGFFFVVEKEGLRRTERTKRTNKVKKKGEEEKGEWGERKEREREREGGELFPCS